MYPNFAAPVIKRRKIQSQESTTLWNCTTQEARLPFNTVNRPDKRDTFNEWIYEASSKFMVNINISLVHRIRVWAVVGEKLPINI